MQIADRIAEILAREGVEFIVGFPENRLFNAAPLVGIRPIITRTERVAINIVDGFTRVTNGRRTAVCAVQYGPGAEAAFAGVAQAFGDRTPFLVLPSEYDRIDQTVPPNFTARDAFQHITSWAATLNEAQNVPEVLRRAFTLLRGSPRSGPVVVSVAHDLLNEEASGEPWAYSPTRNRVYAAARADVDETLGAVLAAANPVIVAGQGVLYAEASDQLRLLAERLGVPVATSLNGKSAFPEHHSLALGTAGRSRPATVDRFLDRADVVLGVGTSFTRSFYTRPMPSSARIGLIVDAVSQFASAADVSFGCIGDARIVLEQLLARAPTRGDRRRIVEAEVAKEKEAFRRSWEARLTSDDEPISPYRIIWELMHTVDRERTIVTHDAGNPRDQMVPFYEAVVPRTYIGWGKSTQLGSGLGLAMGARLARPDWLAVNFMGDAAFGMVGMDFETAVRCQLPVLTIVMNNGVLGGYGEYMPDAVRLHSANRVGGEYAAIAEALGGFGQRVTAAKALRPALERAIERVTAGVPALVEVLTREEPEFPLGST